MGVAVGDVPSGVVSYVRRGKLDVLYSLSFAPANAYRWWAPSFSAVSKKIKIKVSPNFNNCVLRTVSRKPDQTNIGLSQDLFELALQRISPKWLDWGHLRR